MQVQNLPRAGEEHEADDGTVTRLAGAREVFVAPGFSEWLDARGGEEGSLRGSLDVLPDEVIVSVDFDAFEMRTWAQCCLNILGYSDLASILNDPERCPHVEMGATLTGRKVELPHWKDAYAKGYALKKTDKAAYKDMRNLAKGPNFGLPGGMGWARLMDYCRVGYGVVLTPDEAQRACRVWRDVYAEAQPYLDHIANEVLPSSKRGAKGTLIQFVSKRMRGGVGFCDAANGYFQGLAADAAKAAGWAVAREAYVDKKSPLYGARPLAFVHDEWLYAVRRPVLHEAAHRMRDLMVGAAQRYCPDVMITASPAACYRWSKQAGDPVYRNGELVPWEERDA
jgi:hypothetical protein